MIIELEPKIIPYSRKIQHLCRCPYYHHPYGCPNYGRKIGCPPNQLLINEVLDFNKRIYLIYTEFDLGKHARKMRQLYPNWSEHQIYCVLYWQPKARVYQRQEEKIALQKYRFDYIAWPEACGVNVTELMRRIGIILEWPPRKITHLVSFGGWRLK